MDRTCRHLSTDEVQTDKDLQRIAREVWKYTAAEQSHSVEDQMRWAKALQLTGEAGGPVSQGIDRLTWVQEGQGGVANLRRSVMPSQDGRGVRSCSKKLARASMYQVRSGGRGAHGVRSGGRAQLDQGALEALMRKEGWS